jgi:hypothetical protein
MIRKSLLVVIIYLSSIIALLAHSSCSLEHPCFVFVIGGQSNALGQGDNVDLMPPYDTPRRDVMLWDASTSSWVDMQGGYGRNPDEFGLEVSLGHKLADVLGGDIRIVKLAVGGSGLNDQWAPGTGELYQALNKRVGEALASLPGMVATVSGMFWVQGERDSRDIDDGMNPANNYEVNLTNLISSYRRDFNNRDMTFIIGKIHASLDTSPGQYPYAELVRTAMENVAFDDELVGIVDTDTFSLKDDALHFNSEGIIDLGNALAEEHIALTQWMS